jgi:hypothetical protein
MCFGQARGQRQQVAVRSHDRMKIHVWVMVATDGVNIRVCSTILPGRIRILVTTNKFPGRPSRQQAPGARNSRGVFLVLQTNYSIDALARHPKKLGDEIPQISLAIESLSLSFNRGP